MRVASTLRRRTDNRVHASCRSLAAVLAVLALVSAGCGSREIKGNGDQAAAPVAGQPSTPGSAGPAASAAPPETPAGTPAAGPVAAGGGTAGSPAVNPAPRAANGGGPPAAT